MWSKEIEKRRKASGYKKKRSERFDTLEASNLSLLMKAII
jgi:hypothetical protein